MHNLLKFISKKKYLEDFLNGKLYMNSLNYFWENGFDEQKDIFEGVVSTVPVKDMYAFPIGFQSIQACDYRFRAEGYRYCNVLCFYKLRYSMNGPFVNYTYSKNMSQFGEYVVFITNESEFLRRVQKAAEKRDFKFLCGDVRYHQLKKDGSPTKEGNQMILKASERLFDIAELEQRGLHIVIRDCFDKSIKYREQQEWRIALYRGKKDTDACYLEVGDLSDIVRWFTVEQFETEINRHANQYGYSNLEGWYGNISRKDMRARFCTLGDCKTSLFATIG